MVTFGHFEPEILEDIKNEIRLVYGLSIVMEESYIDLTEFYNPSRRQYNANDLLGILKNIPPGGAIKTLGIFRIDLYIPILTYIFGQAILSGPIAIASMYRLRNELYGLEKNNDLLRDRFTKVIIHELGHSFGLVHCYNPGCVMRSSTYVEDIDQKKKHLCSKCMEKLSRE